MHDGRAWEDLCASILNRLKGVHQQVYVSNESSWTNIVSYSLHGSLMTT